MARYSTSVVDQATSCLLLFQEIKESPKDIHQGVVDLILCHLPPNQS